MIRHMFPEGFLWGSATASYQVEGGIENCDWALASKRGAVPACGKAADHYNRYKEDFEIAKSLGQNAHRLSVEWARIEPIEGEFDQDVITHYREVFQDLKDKGFYVSLTMWHFTLPDWFAEKGAFASKSSMESFERYAKKVVESFHDLVDDFCTMNEPMVYVSNGYLRGNWPPFKRTFFQHVAVHRNLAKAHIRVYRLVKKEFPHVSIGIVKDNIFFEGKNIFTKAIARFMIWFWNHRFLNMIAKYTDYIGLNYYFHSVLGEKPKGPFTDFGWEIHPEGIYEMLKDLSRYKKPLYITENGLADEEDLKRAKFIKDHVAQVYRAIKDGIVVRGYYHWSLLDNYEWAAGFSKRFGLVEIHYDTMKRKIRSSAYVYKSICENNGF